MQSIILYGSQYGASKQYAEALSARTGIPAQPYKTAKDLGEIDTLIYVGGIYAGKVLGLTQTVRTLTAPRRFLLLTVGLASPASESGMEEIRKHLKKELSPALLEQMEHTHLRGAIDYEKLTIKHTAMMSFFISFLKRQPPEKHSRETIDMMETYGQKVDYIDLTALDPVVESLQ